MLHLWEIYREKDMQNIKNIVEGYYFKDNTKDSISLEFMKKKTRIIRINTRIIEYFELTGLTFPYSNIEIEIIRRPRVKINSTKEK